LPTFAHSIDIDASADEVFAQICDPQVHFELHPLNQTLEVHSAGATETTFTTERFYVMGLPLTMTVHATMRPDAEALEVVFDAKTSVGIGVVTRYRVEPNGSGSILHESATVSAPPLMKAKSVKEARAAHNALLDAFKRRLEG